MSPAEKDAAILRIVKDRAEARKTRVLLENEIKEAGSTLRAFGETLCKLDFDSNYPHVKEWTERSLALLSPQLASNIREYVELRSKMKDLDSQAEKLGI